MKVWLCQKSLKCTAPLTTFGQPSAIAFEEWIAKCMSFLFIFRQHTAWDSQFRFLFRNVCDLFGLLNTITEFSYLQNNNVRKDDPVSAVVWTLVAILMSRVWFLHSYKIQSVLMRLLFGSGLGVYGSVFDPVGKP